MRPLRRLPDPQLALDVLLALAVGLFLAFLAQQEPGRDGAGPVGLAGYALIGLAAAALVLRRRWPGCSLAVAATASFGFSLYGQPNGPIFITVMIAMYSVAAWRPTRYAVVGASLLATVHLLWVMFALGRLADVLDTLGFIGAPLALGIGVRATRQSRAQATAADRSRQAYEERLRIAQEVHDSVGHNLAMISMNAGAALHVLSKQSARSPQLEDTLRAIRQAGNGALDELRATLATFTGQLAVDNRQPAPALALLPELVAATRVAGLEIALDVSGEPGQLPAAVDAAGYRIVQEALTNVVRHAAATAVTVRLRYAAHHVELQIRDDGRGQPPTGRAGSGLTSMRERVRALGGTLRAGPHDEGGYEVYAELPCRRTEPAR